MVKVTDKVWKPLLLRPLEHSRLSSKQVVRLKERHFAVVAVQLYVEPQRLEQFAWLGRVWKDFFY